MDLNRLWPVVAVVLLALLPYAGALNNDFVWDDHPVIVNNTQLHRLFPLLKFFSGQGFLKQRSLMAFSLALDYHLWGPNPLGFHLTNLLLHVLACVGVFSLALRLLPTVRAAFWGGLLFAVHPVHAEAVAALLGRSDLLAAGACLWGFLCYDRARRSSHGMNVLFYLLSLLFFAVACLSKETGVVLAGWVALYEFFGLHSRPFSLWKTALLLLPFGLVAAFYLAFMVSVSGPTIAKTGWWGGSLQSNFLMGFQVFWEYLRLLFVPLNLSPWYVIPIPRDIWDPKLLLGMLAFLVILGVFVFSWLRRSLFGFLLGWYLVCYLPLSNLIPINGSMMSERWLYVGSIAFCLGMGWVWEQGRIRLSLALRRGLNILGVVILLGLGVRSASAVSVWRTDFSLFGEILREHPRLYKAHLWLADSYNRVDSLREAEKHYRIALALSPDNSEVHADLGILYDKQGRFPDAIREYQIALRLGGENALPRLNLGIAYEHLGHYHKALGEYQKALSLGAERPKAFYRMGECYLQLGDTLHARDFYVRALSEDPTFLEAGKRLSLLPR
jgi:hypothetical protein